MTAGMLRSMLYGVPDDTVLVFEANELPNMFYLYSDEQVETGYAFDANENGEMPLWLEELRNG